MLDVRVAVADLHQLLPAADAERLRLLRLLRDPRRPDHPPRRDLHRRDFGDPVKCPPCTQVTQCVEPLRPLRDLHRQADPARRLRAGRRHAAPPAADYTPCGPGTSTPATSCPANTGCVTGCCRPLYIIG